MGIRKGKTGGKCMEGRGKKGKEVERGKKGKE